MRKYFKKDKKKGDKIIEITDDLTFDDIKDVFEDVDENGEEISAKKNEEEENKEENNEQKKDDNNNNNNQNNVNNNVKEETGKKKKKHKKKKRYPKNFNPKNPGPMPDPERWLPKMQKKKFRAKNKLAHQGAIADNETTTTQKFK